MEQGHVLLLWQQSRKVAQNGWVHDIMLITIPCFQSKLMLQPIQFFSWSYISRLKGRLLKTQWLHLGESLWWECSFLMGYVAWVSVSELCGRIAWWPSGNWMERKWQSYLYDWSCKESIPGQCNTWRIGWLRVWCSDTKATHMNELQSDSFGTYTLTNGLQILDNSCTFNICSTIGICIVVGNTSADNFL